MKDKSLAAAILVALCAPSFTISAAPELKYVVIVSRHGVRSPTWPAARLNQYSAEPWPDWGVPPADLTPHGRRLIEILGGFYRLRFASQGLLAGDGCGDQGRVYIWADTDQRTLETGRAFSGSILPGCGVPVNSKPKGVSDPMFAGVPGPAELARDALRLRIGTDSKKLIADHLPALKTLQYILDGGHPTQKKLLATSAEIGIELQGQTIELQGPFAVSSTLSENLLLEYAGGMRGAGLGWGRLTRQNLYQVLELHRVYADLMRRTPYLARARGSNLMGHVLASLQQAVLGKVASGSLGPPGTAVLILSGHDTNQSNLAGMLKLTWTLPGYQPDETPPGGALIFSLWREAGGGQFFVRAEFLAASLDQMHDALPLTLKTPPLIQPVFIPECGNSKAGCPWQKFEAMVRRAIE